MNTPGSAVPDPAADPDTVTEYGFDHVNVIVVGVVAIAQPFSAVAVFHCSLPETLEYPPGVCSTVTALVNVYVIEAEVKLAEPTMPSSQNPVDVAGSKRPSPLGPMLRVSMYPPDFPLKGLTDLMIVYA